MSEGDVTRIQDEDVLRRMWQQTEDFGRKKEIRAHMYRLREERLRNLYSPEPASNTKGSEFTSAQKHVSSFADQTFQSMKSKEVRDAGSPPKEFTYRGQDLKELSNAGWNVESEDRKTDDGRTRVKSVNANIEGQYDVEGGRGQFAAVDRQRNAVTEYQDDNTKLRRDETSSNTAAHEHVVQQTEDGTRFASTTSSSNTSSKFQQVSSTVHETAPAPRPMHDYDQHETNRNENISITSNTSDYEQNLKSNDFQKGELVSRKVNYPDDSTKVIVETRCLPDGTRVTSTRREFHAPAQSTRSEYQTRSESKYSSQHKSDTSESTKVIRHTADNRTDDIVDSQRHVDDNDFKRQLREYARDDDTNSETQRINQHRETKINRKETDHAKTTDDYAQTRYEARVRRVVDSSRNVEDDSSRVHHQTDQRFTDNIDQTDRREVIETYENSNVSQNDIKESHHVRDTEERMHSIPQTGNKPGLNIPRNADKPGKNIAKTGGEPDNNIPLSLTVEPSQLFPVIDEQIHNVTKDTKTRDTKVEERKTSSEHYQTTYQTDYQQKKVSNDWSPTHQAWASTLRADTPSTTRPSTRASSPGSRTYKSSTSSLRSSVSPDKCVRKPSSRGSSPSKVDRYSPTRSVTSDHYSSTLSTRSVVESKTNTHTSPERKPPIGRSPTRSGNSPDRKPQDNNRQRPSTSPDKQTRNFTTRPNVSPERKSSHKTPADEHYGTSAPRQSPEKPSNQISEYKTSRDNGSPSRPSVSPQRKPTNDTSKHSLPTSSFSPDRNKTDGYIKNLKGSPEREVGYIQHTTPNREPQDSTKRPSISPDKQPSYMKPTAASKPALDTRKPTKPVDESSRDSTSSFVKSTNSKHFKSQMTEDHYKSIDEETKTHCRTDKTHGLPYDKATSPSRNIPEKDAPDSSELPSLKSRSPSPQKKNVIIEHDGGIDKTVEQIDIINKYDKHTEDKYAVERMPKEAPKEKDFSSRDSSPTKFGTYDKKKTRDVEVNTFTHRDSNSPNKKVPEARSPTKKNQRDSSSPSKSPTQDSRHKHTAEFIITEKTSEEVNKKTATKERPRQLVTPSSSPIRQPKIDTEPSTGQSSPTTSVSGFVYFGSPIAERPVVTDLDDDFETGTDDLVQSQYYTRSETSDVQRPQSPSKIPCRSPSPEKRDKPTTGSLPRKSSLKKPSNYVDPVSPMDKPPCSFRVSPTEDKPIELSHKVVKKDNPSEPEVSSAMKTKPPLNRRETYEDRCRLILGMVDTDTAENGAEETKKIKKNPESYKSSPSVSPCDSPVLKESSLFADIPLQDKVRNIKTDVTNFISNEKEDINNTTKTHNVDNPNFKATQSNPTKLQVTNSKITQVDTRQKKDKEVFTKPEKKDQLPRLHSPEKDNARPSPERQYQQKLRDGEPKFIAPRAESPDEILQGTSPSKLPRPSASPERKQPLPVRESPDNNQNSQTGHNIYSFDEKITIENTEFDTTSSTKNIIEEKTETLKGRTPRTRVLESPTRHPKSPDRIPPSESSSRSRASTSPIRRTESPERHANKDSFTQKSGNRQPEKSSPSKPRQSPEKTPGYMKSTTAVSSKYESASSTIDVEEFNTTKSLDNKYKTSKTSETRKHSQDLPRSVSPTKTSQTNTRRTNENSPERTSAKDSPVKSAKRKDSPSELPGFKKSTASTAYKNEISTTVTEDINEITTSKLVDQKHQSSRFSKSPILKASQEPRTPSPTKFTSQASSSYSPKKLDVSPERKSVVKQPSSPTKDKEVRKPKDSQPQERLATRPVVDKKVSSNKKIIQNETTKGIQETITTKTIQNKYPESSKLSHNKNLELDYTKDSTSNTSKATGMLITTHFDDVLTNEDIQTIATVQKSYTSEPVIKTPGRNLSPEPKKGTPDKETPTKLPTVETPMRPSVSPERKPSYMKPTASALSKLETTSTILGVEETSKTFDQSKRNSPSRQSPEHPIKDKSSYIPNAEEPRQLRTPSPTKKTVKVTEVSTDFLISEREQEILDRVHKSLRKLSPERREKSPMRESSSNKTTTSLQDLDITVSEYNVTCKSETADILGEHEISKANETYPEKTKTGKLKEQKTPSKPSSRTVSPTKRISAVTTTKVERSPESSNKSRSISPRKPLTQTDRPQSPQVPKTSGIKPRDQVPLIRKPTPATLSTYKIEKLTSDVKKTNVAKQNAVLKTTTTSKTTSRIVASHPIKPNEPESKRIPTPKGINDSVIPRKEPVTRTSSDSNVKIKKTLPQRMKSKPEIQVNDISPKSPKHQKPVIKEPHSKLPAKPKSATALNTSIDEDDVIIDVQQSKSSRENSPDRICPTPVNFADDVGTPRFPDEVSEPDDEYRRRSYHTIHETESVVDDIVEICEDEQLFVKKNDVTSEYDDSLLSVNDKVNKFTTKIESVTKPRDTTTTFNDTERRIHSDFIDENLKSDECLLSVSEKVNKFAMGPRTTKESRSPSRKIIDEYDKTTSYQDDYTKLSVNDKAHLFVETAENIKLPKVKTASKVDRPDLSNVEESLKKDDCLLSVSDKVNKFVKSAENFLTETQVIEQKEQKIREQHEKIMRQIADENEDEADETFEIDETTNTDKRTDNREDTRKPDNKEFIIHPKVKYVSSKNVKPTERTSTVKITTLRSSEAVKKAKALFENIASTQKTKDVTQTTTKTTKLTDIGVVKDSVKTDSTIVLHHSVEDISANLTDVDSEVDASPQKPRTKDTPSSEKHTRPHHSHVDDKPHSSPNRLTPQSPEVNREKSPVRKHVDVKTAKTVQSKYPAAPRAVSPKHGPETQGCPEQKSEKVPGYLLPTKTSQIKEEAKIVEETAVSTRRGSGKFGVELRRTSIERSTVSSERRRSVEHHQPCIEDIFDLDLLEQMLEKVVGYEQRRRIRSQIRVVKKETDHVNTNTYAKTKYTSTTMKPKLPDKLSAKSSENQPKSKTPQRTLSPQSQSKTSPSSHPKESSSLVLNGHAKESVKTMSSTRLRPQSPEKSASKNIQAAKSPDRASSPNKKRTVSPSKLIPKSKANRFNEYASAYMKKVGLNEADNTKFVDKKSKKTTDSKQRVSHETQDTTVQEFTTTRNLTERTSSRDVIEIVQVNGKRSPSPAKTTERITGTLRKPQSPERSVPSPINKAHIFERKAQSPERRVNSPGSKAPDRRTHTPDQRAQSPEQRAQSPEQRAQSPERKRQSPERKLTSPAERLYQRSPSPDFKRQKSDTKKETIIKTVYDVEKKIPTKPVQEEKPSWVTNRNLKKITSETRTFSTKKMETEKPKYRATSPSKVISKPIDVITSSYGPGPLDADGRPLFGIKALRNGASNFQVKGTVVRQEFHSRNGGEPEGTVSVTAYSSRPEELEQLMAAQGAEPPSRIHGLSAITTTKKFGGQTGISMSTVNTKEERASLEQFTHTDRKMESHMDRIETCGFEPVENISDTRKIESKKSERTDKSNKRREERVTEVRKEKKEDRREKVERREDNKKTVRQSSVKSLTEKFIKNANEGAGGRADRGTYPRAGLILRTTSTLRDSVSSDDAHPPGLTRAESEQSISSVEEVVVRSTERGGSITTSTSTSRRGPSHQHQRTSTVTHHEPVVTTRRTTTVITGSQVPVITKVVTQGPVTTRVVTSERRAAAADPTVQRSFLDSNTKVTGVQDILTRMKNADIVMEDGDTTEESEARALLNKFLGATVLMAGMQNYVTDQPSGKLHLKQETVRTSTEGSKVTSVRLEDVELDQCWDETLLRKLLEECTDYEQRRRVRARIRTLMAEQEACASAVTDALGAANIAGEAEGAGSGAGEAREEDEVTVTSSVRRDSSEQTVTSSTTKSSKVTESVSLSAPKPVSPFAKFRQLEKQNSTNSPNSPKSPQSPGSPSQPYFKFTDPALQCSALTIKERLLQWCRDNTRDYENVKLENFSTSWADGLAFCALIHHFLPNTFDYSKLTPERRRHNFTLAFKVADEKAGIYPLLDVEDMVAMRKPDWKCVFTYVQSIYRRFKGQD